MPPSRLACGTAGWPAPLNGALLRHGAGLAVYGSRDDIREDVREDITALLGRWHDGEDGAFETLVERVYTELRQMANGLLRRERDEHTLQPTALVHEAYLRLNELRDLRLRNRRHFYGAAAKAMRRILVDHARHRKALKRGGGLVRHVPIEEAMDAPLDGAGSGAGVDGVDFECLDRALGALAAVAPDKARVVELRYIMGLSVEETATLLEMAPATVKRHWAFARAWLYRELAAAS
jgi:RNA polymerase sigma-70 factor, ECF subfamily